MMKIPEQNIYVSQREVSTWPVEVIVSPGTKINWRIEEKEGQKEGDGRVQLRCEGRSEPNEMVTLFEQILDEENQVSWVFEKEGKYYFKCLLNPSICGVIQVTKNEENQQGVELESLRNQANCGKSSAYSRRSSRSSNNTETLSGNLSTCLSFQENQPKDRENNANEEKSKSYQKEIREKQRTKSHKQQTKIDLNQEDIVSQVDANQANEQVQAMANILLSDQINESQNEGLEEQKTSKNKLKQENRQKKLKEQQEIKQNEYNLRIQNA